MNAAEQKLIDTIDALGDDIIDFTGRLVAEPSTLGHEASVLELVETELTGLGLAPIRVPIEPDKLADQPGFAPVPWGYDGRYNLAAVRPAEGRGGKSALFNGHLDVVDPEPVSFWHTDPFRPTIVDGKMYGRGAGDMKSGVAAMIYAAHAVGKAGFGLNAPLTVETVIEEECCGNGALACMAAGYDAEAVLIPEPFGPTILTAQLGVMWFKVTIKGRPVHVYEAAAGTNAIEKSYHLIKYLREMEAEMNGENVPEIYRDIPHPLNLNIGIISGGNWPSTVAAEAEFHGRMSFFPGQSYESVRDRIAAVIEIAAQADPWLKENPPQVEFYGFRSEGHHIAEELPAFAALRQAHTDLTGQPVADYVATCTTDLRAFHFFGQGQATCFGPQGGNFHGADEWVDLASIVETAKTYALFLSRWCGLAE